MGGEGRDPGATRIGSFLKDKWRIDRRLGQGGIGTVYAGQHRNGNRVAIKVLLREYAGDTDLRARFKQEGYAANTVGHPGAVRVLDDDVTEDGLPFLVMELLEGETLEDLRCRLGGRLPLGEVLPVAEQLLVVLEHAHEKGIFHRDIKPENIFLEYDGTVRVLDFGIARVRERARTNTGTGMLLGTPEFMPPEQALGDQRSVDASTDTFAVGATLFKLLAGVPARDAESAASQLLLASTEPVRSLHVVAPDLPPSIVRIVDRALCFKKKDRWTTARAMRLALEQARAEAKDAIGPGGTLRIGGGVSTLGDVSDSESTIEVAPPTDRAGEEPQFETKKMPAPAPLPARVAPSTSTAAMGPGRPAAISSAPPVPQVAATPPSRTPLPPQESRSDLAFASALQRSAARSTWVIVAIVLATMVLVSGAAFWVASYVLSR